MAKISSDFSAPVQSSHLAHIQYVSATSTLTIWFWNGSQYEYYDVSVITARELLYASSHGKYFWANIRGGYGETKVG